MLPSWLFTALYGAADGAIAHILAHGGARTARPSGEVSAVRTMTLDGFDDIARDWSAIVKPYGYRLDLRAVFCHSRPHVRFSPVPHPLVPGGPNPRRCELADLLVVIDHVDAARAIDDRRAVLIQAKMLTGGVVKPMGKEWIQHELLAWLPAFTFVDAAYDPRRRDLNGSPLVGSPNHTAEYGGIDLSVTPPVWQQEMTQTTPPWFVSTVLFGRFLAAMATADPNYSRDAVRGGTDDWSFTVDELLRVTAARPITKKSGIARGNDNIVGYVVDTSALPSSYSDADDGGAGGGFVEGDIADWPEGPISTIHLTVRSIDDPGED